jgi:CTP:molybdopterin cytidylyltransferase MocA
MRVAERIILMAGRSQRASQGQQLLGKKETPIEGHPVL